MFKSFWSMNSPWKSILFALEFWAFCIVPAEVFSGKASRTQTIWFVTIDQTRSSFRRNFRVGDRLWRISNSHFYLQFGGSWWSYHTLIIRLSFSSAVYIFWGKISESAPLRLAFSPYPTVIRGQVLHKVNTFDPILTILFLSINYIYQFALGIFAPTGNFRIRRMTFFTKVKLLPWVSSIYVLGISAVMTSLFIIIHGCQTVSWVKPSYCKVLNSIENLIKSLGSVAVS